MVELCSGDLSSFSVAFSFLEFQCEAVFSSLSVFSEVCCAVSTCVGLDIESSIFPRFVWLTLLFPAFGAFYHVNPVVLFCLFSLKRFLAGRLVYVSSVMSLKSSRLRNI